MKQALKVLLVLGETSGDLQASLVLKPFLELLKTNELIELEIFSVSGKLCLNQIENTEKLYNFRIKHTQLFSINELNVMGFSDVIKNYFKIRNVFESIVQIVKKENIQKAILVDYPGFNLRLARTLKQMNVDVCYHILPKFWAHGETRADTLIHNCTDLLSILPFEAQIIQNKIEKLYLKKSQKTTCHFIGNPLKDAVLNNVFKHIPVSKEFFNLVIIPGSRKGEVKYSLPILFQSLILLRHKLNFYGCDKNITAYLPIAQSFEENTQAWFYETVQKSILNFTTQEQQWLNKNIVFLKQQTYDAFKQCDYGWVFSGTASLEAAFLGLPMSVLFATSKINIALGKILVKCKYISLANLCLNKLIFPEYIQENATPENLAAHAVELLLNEKKQSDMKQELAQVSELFPPKSSQIAAQIWCNFILREKKVD
jgi:lipid-A-disaccharide synthase